MLKLDALEPKRFLFFAERAVSFLRFAGVTLVFSEKLRERTAAYFEQKFGISPSDEEVEGYLHDLAALYQAYAGVEEGDGRRDCGTVA